MVRWASSRKSDSARWNSPAWKAPIAASNSVVSPSSISRFNSTATPSPGGSISLPVSALSGGEPASGRIGPDDWGTATGRGPPFGRAPPNGASN